jgi:hypothetical protein
VAAVQQTLAATPGSGGGSALGVSVTTGTSGSFTITLNDTDTITAGTAVEIRIGTNATTGSTGDEQMTNPGTVGSYDIDIETQTAASATIDTGIAIIVVIDSVGLSAQASPTPGGGGGGQPPTPTPNFGAITFWPSSLQAMTLQQFSAAAAEDVATLLSMSETDLYAILTAQYPGLSSSNGQALASVLGLSNQQFYNMLTAQYPALATLTVTQLANATAQGMAAIAGVSIEDFYAFLGLDMQDIDTLLIVTSDELYTFLSVDDLQQLLTEPSSFPETSITSTVTNTSGAVQLGVAGDPYAYVSGTAGTLGLSVIQNGNWQITTYAQASDDGGNTSLSVQVLVLDENGNETLMFNHTITNNLPATSTEYITYTNQPLFSFDPGDRVIVRYYASTSGATGPVTVTVYYEGTNRYSYIQTPPSDLLSPCFRIADFTSDCLVNLPDLSIMMYNWPVVRNRPETDLNGDGVVGIVDFSILLYWWTG